MVPLHRPFIFGLVLFGLACASHPPASEPGSGSGGTNRARHLAAPYVVLLSLDGFRHDYLDLYPTPALQRVAREGARADAMIPVFPTKTYPTHYSVATGMYAENHRLVGNRFWDEEKGLYRLGNREAVEDGSWYGGEPLWVSAERQGMVAAAFYFIGSEADVGGVRPSDWNRYDASVPNDVRVDSVISWLARPAERRPHLITLYFSDLDDAGHGFGPDSPEVAEAVRRVDGQIGRLLEGIGALPHGEDVYLVVVSDHGMLRREAARAQVIDTARIPGIRVVETGPYASIWVDDGGGERAARVRDTLRAMLPEADVWLRQDVPERLHYSADPRIGDVVALARPGASLVLPGRAPEEDGFTHGWDNLTPEMGAVFLAWGPRIRPGTRIGAFEAIHVYPFVAHLLGLRPNPDIDGRLEVLAPILEGDGR